MNATPLTRSTVIPASSRTSQWIDYVYFAICERKRCIQRYVNFLLISQFSPYLQNMHSHYCKYRRQSALPPNVYKIHQLTVEKLIWTTLVVFNTSLCCLNKFNTFRRSNCRQTSFNPTHSTTLNIQQPNTFNNPTHSTTLRIQQPYTFNNPKHNQP